MPREYPLFGSLEYCTFCDYWDGEHCRVPPNYECPPMNTRDRQEDP